MLAPLGRNSLLVFIKAYLCRRRLSHLTSSPGHAGAGGARSWAINIRISWNICRGTATSAIKGRVAAVAHDLGADLDQLLAQAGQRPRLRRLRHCQRPHEIAEIVGQRVELEADVVGGEGAARQAGPLDRALAFFDVLLAGAAVVVECNDALSRPRQVGDDDADALTKLAGARIA